MVQRVDEERTERGLRGLVGWDNKMSNEGIFIVIVFSKGKIKCRILNLFIGFLPVPLRRNARSFETQNIYSQGMYVHVRMNHASQFVTIIVVRYGNAAYILHKITNVLPPLPTTPVKSSSTAAFSEQLGGSFLLQYCALRRWPETPDPVLFG